MMEIINRKKKRNWGPLVGGLAAGGAAVLTKFSGVPSSVINKFRMDKKNSVRDIPAGTPLLEHLWLGNIVEHSGIYLGDGQVVEVLRRDRDGKGIIHQVDVNGFFNGEDRHGKMQVRRGDCIYAACDKATLKPLASEKAARFARQTCGEDVDYNLGFNNCHFFAASCFKGELVKEGLSLKAALKQVEIFSIGQLTKVISEILNDGKPICWCRVEKTRDFQYSYAPYHPKFKKGHNGVPEGEEVSHDGIA